MEKPVAQDKTTKYADTQRLRQLARMPLLLDNEVAEIRELAARLGVAVKMQHVDLTSWGQASEYTIG